MNHCLARVRIAAGLAALLLGACGGGGGWSDGGGDSPSARLAQQCAPQNPFTADALEPTGIGSLSREKQWVDAYIDEAYLWYDESPAVDATGPQYSDDSDVFASIENYFLALLTPQTTASGRLKDQFSFIFPTREWNELSESGRELGYGMQLAFNPTPPRNTRVVFVEAASPAVVAGIARGMALVSADGVSTEATGEAQVAALNAALFPATAGEVHRFEFQRTDGSRFFADLAANDITRDPVPIVQTLAFDGRSVGYLLFNDHIATAESQLIDAVTLLRDAGIDALVLDLRYNGGGFLYIASQLAYMIAGPARTTGQVFERLLFNDKRDVPPEQSDFPFIDCSSDRDFDCRDAPTLPTLNLDRVYVITSPGSCSASESIINGLRGVDVDVRLIGDTTCGKPYGFSAKDNCGISYFPIEFQGVNAKGFGDYANGFAPDCAAGDDLTVALGDPAETSLAVALRLQADGSCAAGKTAPAPVRLLRSPVRESRWLQERR